MTFDIVPILNQYKIEYKPMGDELCFKCPVCEREDHFYYNRIKNLAVCQRCKCEFNSVGFLIVGLGWTKEDAVQAVFGLEDQSLAGIRGKVTALLKKKTASEEFLFPQTFFKNPLPENLISVSKKLFPKALSERGVDLSTAKQMEVKFCQTRGRYFNRLIFPVTTLKNKTFVAPSAFIKEKAKIVKKAVEKRGRNFRKSLFPFGSLMSEVLYGYNEIKEKSLKKLFVVEGIWDVLRIRKYRFEATCSFGDKVGFTQAILLSETNAKEIYLMLDGGVPVKRLIKCVSLLNKVCFDKKVFLCIPFGEKDPDDLTEEEFIYCSDNRIIGADLIGKISFKKDAENLVKKMIMRM